MEWIDQRALIEWIYLFKRSGPCRPLPSFCWVRAKPISSALMERAWGVRVCVCACVSGSSFHLSHPCVKSPSDSEIRRLIAPWISWSVEKQSGLHLRAFGDRFQSLGAFASSCWIWDIQSGPDVSPHLFGYGEFLDDWCCFVFLHAFWSADVPLDLKLRTS